MSYQEKPLINFTKEQLETLIPLIQDYFKNELELELSSLEAQFSLDFITEKLGKYYYNRGVEDSIAFMNRRVEDMYTLLKFQKDE